MKHLEEEGQRCKGELKAKDDALTHTAAQLELQQQAVTQLQKDKTHLETQMQEMQQKVTYQIFSRPVYTSGSPYLVDDQPLGWGG